MFKQLNAINSNQKKFDNREVGFNHPDLPSFLRLANNGDIQIMVNGEVGIVISQIQKSIMLVADVVRVVTKENGGFRWNQLNFNSEATSYNEPTFTYSREEYDIYSGLEDFMDW